jgi:hypothetical protein
MDELQKPILPGKGASDYERYLRTDELLDLQKPPEAMSHPDELVRNQITAKMGTGPQKPDGRY